MRWGVLSLPVFLILTRGLSFASLLDEEKGGRFGIAMSDGEVVSQGYEHNTNVFRDPV